MRAYKWGYSHPHTLRVLATKFEAFLHDLSLYNYAIWNRNSRFYGRGAFVNVRHELHLHLRTLPLTQRD